MKDKNGNHICTAQEPWKPDMVGRCGHPDAVECGEQRDGYPSGDLQTYKCPHCGITFEEELPQ